ncbi:MAG: aminopeptidase N [Micrococcales bacterium]|nr:aminopeptidase N [Micrococcales bacterium]
MPGHNLTREEAARRSGLVTVESYEVTLDLVHTGRTFMSTSKITFTASAGATTFVDLVAWRVREVELNGEVLDVAQAVTDGKVTLGPLADHNVVTIVAECEYSRTGEGLHRFVDPVDGQTYLYSQFEIADASRVFACFDQPDLKAPFTFTVIAPAGWTVISNERPASLPTSTADVATWQFAPTRPLPTYVTAIVAGPYQGTTAQVTTRDGRELELGVHCRASLAQHLDPEEIIATTSAGLAFYEEAFDHDFPFSKYDQVFVPEFNAGAMENAGAVTLSESYVFRSVVPDAVRERRAITVLHELAHMWFGNLVTMRWWDDLWLNESFAEYVSHLATVRTTRWTGAWATFAGREKSWAYQQDQLPTTHPVVADMHDLEDVEVNFDGITYAKGASVLRQLVAWVGEEEFFAGVRAYFARYAWGSTTLADLLAELERTSGRDLSTWSRLWLQQAGVGCLAPELVASGTKIEQLALLHTRDDEATLPPHRLAVAGYDLVDGALTRAWRIELDVVEARTLIPEAAGRRRPTVLLLNDGDLAYTKVRLDLSSMRAAMASRHTFDDPLTRALVWGMWWDAARDGEVAPTTFVSSVADQVATECDSSQVLLMFRQVTTALTQWVPPERRLATAGTMVARLRELVDDTAIDPDVRHQCLRAVCRHARRANVLDWLDDLLAGKHTIPGITLDADLRWEVLTGLVTAGVADEEDIADEQHRDPSATGVRAAALARATVPTVHAKSRAWRAVVDQGMLTNAQQAATIEGFLRTWDSELLISYVPRYFDALEDVWATRSSEPAQAIAEGLFPLPLVGTPQVNVVAEADMWLEDHPDAAPALRRIVTEGRDAARRAAVAQAADLRE